MRIRLLILVTLCGALGTGLAGAQGSQGSSRQGQDTRDTKSPGQARSSPRPPFQWWTSEQYVQELKLSAEQTAKIAKIFQESMDRLKVEKNELDRAKADFSELMKKGAATERELLRAADLVEMARYAVSKERTSLLVRIHSVLTPDQRQGLEAILKRSDGTRSRSQ
jgi:Spy/CpxP family protein refolding chaperone